MREVFATTQERRCWGHKTMNVLNAMPKFIQAKAKDHLHDIWQTLPSTFSSKPRCEMRKGSRQAGQGPGRATNIL